jgi:hypothetical protein
VWHHILHVALPILGAVACILFGWLVGHLWRKQYKGALALRQKLEASARSAASATAFATASGNRVDIHVGSHDVGASSDVVSDGSLFLPSSLRGWDRARLAPGAAALTDGHNDVPGESVELYRPTALSRLLFGGKHPVSRGVPAVERGTESGE